MVLRYHGNFNIICVVTFGWERADIFRLKWERNNAISLVTVKMGSVIPISYGNLRNTNITAENTAAFYRGNFTEKRPEKSHISLVCIINDTLARSIEPVVTECKEHTIHTQTQVVASRKPKEIKRTHEGEANLTT